MKMKLCTKSNNRIFVDKLLDFNDRVQYLTSVFHHVDSAVDDGYYHCDYFDIINGYWFEFNDDKVKVTAEPPACVCNNIVNNASIENGTTTAHYATHVSRTARINFINNNFNRRNHSILELQDDDYLNTRIGHFDDIHKDKNVSSEVNAFPDEKITSK